MILRAARAADAATLAALARRTFTETFGHLYAPRDLAAFLAQHTVAAWGEWIADPAGAVLIAEAERAEPAGYARLGPPSLPFTPPAGAIELRQFYVRAPWHGDGTAQRMMRRAIDIARGRGHAWVYLSVFSDNHRARRFYARHGFTEVGPYPFVVGEHEDEDIVMKRAL